MERNAFILFLAGTLTTVLLSCASAPDLSVNKDVELLKSGIYQQAVEHISNNEKNYMQEKNVISFYLDRGMASFYAGDFESSFTDLTEADRLIEEAYTLDISDYADAFFSNKVKKVQYSGEDYEYFYLNLFNALNFYNRGDMEKAMVEIRRSNTKLQYLADEYITNEKIFRDNINKFVGIPASINIGNSALARHLSAIFWRGDGNHDSARIDAEGAVKAFTDYPELYNFPLPSFLVQSAGGSFTDITVPANLARLNVLSFTGLSPIKQISMDNYFWYRITKDNMYNIHRFSEEDTPKEKKVQIDLETLRPILAAFAEMCGRVHLNKDHDNLYYQRTITHTNDLRQMLRDLYVNDAIYAELEQLTERNGFPTAAKVRELLVKIYGNEERLLGFNMAAAVMESGDFLDPFNIAGIDNELSEKRKQGLRLRERAVPVTSIEVALDNGQSFRLELLEDIGAIVNSLYERRKTMRNSQLFLYAVEKKIKGIMDSNDLFSQTMVMSAGMAVTIARSWLFSFFTLPTALFTSKETKDAKIAKQVVKEMGRFDDRMGSFFPDKAFAGGINLAPGIYSLTIKYYNGGNLLYSEHHDNVRAEAGKLNLVSSSILSGFNTEINSVNVSKVNPANQTRQDRLITDMFDRIYRLIDTPYINKHNKQGIRAAVVNNSQVDRELVDKVVNGIISRLLDKDISVIHHSVWNRKYEQLIRETGGKLGKDDLVNSVKMFGVKGFGVDYFIVVSVSDTDSEKRLFVSVFEDYNENVFYETL